MSCGTDRCSGVSASEGGSVAGREKRGVVCRAVVTSHFGGIR